MSNHLTVNKLELAITIPLFTLLELCLNSSKYLQFAGYYMTTLLYTIESIYM